jgi:hypothetical protein
MEENRLLILKVNFKRYLINDYNIKYDTDRICIVVSGMDYNGMYYQIKLKKLEIIEENEYEIIMKGEI